MADLESGLVSTKGQALLANCGIMIRRLGARLGLFDRTKLPPNLLPFSMDHDRPILVIRAGGVAAWATVKLARETPLNVPGPTGFIVDAAFPDNDEISGALFDVCRSWFQRKNIKTVLAFMSDSIMDKRGIAYDQADSSTATYGMAVNPVYYVDTMKRHGFCVYMDMYEFDTSIVELPYPIDRLVKRAKRTIPNCRVETLSGNRIIEFVPQIVEVYNDAYSDNDCYTTLLEDDVMKVAKKMAKFVPYNSIIMVFSGDRPIGLLAAVPDFNRLKVTNPLTLLFVRKKIAELRRYRGIFLGVAIDFRHTAVEVLMYEHYRNNMKAHSDTLVLGWIIDKNVSYLRLIRGKLAPQQTHTYALMRMDL